MNFDGVSGSGTPEEMQLITGFMLASVVQCSEYLRKYPVKSRDDKKHLIMLSPDIQREILLRWLDGVPNVRNLYDDERIDQIHNDPDWFQAGSRGVFCPVFDTDYPDAELAKVHNVEPQQEIQRDRSA